MITTVLADDHPIVRQGLRTLLEKDDGCTVIGEAHWGNLLPKPGPSALRHRPWAASRRRGVV